MCGRYTLKTPLNAFVKQLLLPFEPTIIPRYNIAPTQEVPAVRLNQAKQPELVNLQWGFGARSGGNVIINARSESVATRPMFREAFQHSRCLIPADGFYEWKRVSSRRQPYYIRMSDSKPFAFAGLSRPPSRESSVAECVILTTQANDLVASLHDRMPVIIDAADYATWLDAESSLDQARGLLKPYPSQNMVAFPVSPRVNKAEHEGPDCIVPRRPELTLFDDL